MTGKYAVVDDNNDVQNVIVADSDFEHPEHSPVNADGESVQPGDYLDDASGDFITPSPQIDSDKSQLENGGQDEATLTITTTARTTSDIDLIIDEDFVTTIAVDPNEQHTETLTTTKEASQTITIDVESKNGSDTASIEVVSP